MLHEEGMMWQQNDLLRLSSWDVSRMSIKRDKEAERFKGGFAEVLKIAFISAKISAAPLQHISTLKVLFLSSAGEKLAIMLVSHKFPSNLCEIYLPELWK